MKKILILSCLVLVTSCSWFSNEEEKNEKLKEWKKEKLIKINKDFEYVCLKISLKTEVSKDTVATVFREVLMAYSNLSFKENTFQIKSEHWGSRKERSNPHKLDFLYTISSKLKLQVSTVLKIMNEIDFLYKMDDLYSTISYLREYNDELEEELEKYE